MLKTDELQELTDVMALLNNAKEYASSLNTTVEDLDAHINKLQSIYDIQMHRRAQASIKANRWNKNHPEQHRKHSRDYAKRKASKK